MKAQQKVFRVRRNYNRWVANQTLEDYALRFTAKRARKWSAARVSHTALGAISFLALEAIGGAITLSYGFTNAVAAVLVVAVIIFLTGLPISYHAAKQGIDIDLLTRGAGFGYIGSTITSLIYASFTFIFFALEAAIMALALELTMGIPLSIGYLISAVVVIPLVIYGITLISRFQVWTQPLWVLLQLLPLACIAYQSDEAMALWAGFEPGGVEGGAGLNLIAFGAAAAVLFSLIAQIGEQVDFLRFLPHEEKPSRRWWLAMLSAGPGWILVGALKILIGSFLAVLALHHGIAPEHASDPNRMYLTAFGYMTDSPGLVLLLVGLFVILSQLKINVTNAYAGSIAWSNFFSRLTQNHPGRVVWLVFNVVIALMLMELGIYQVLKEILSVYAIVALAWVGSLVADLVINRPLGLRPATMEFKRAHLYDINPVGVVSMTVACVGGFMAHLGAFGPVPQALSSFIALGLTLVTAPFMAWLTKGRYYLARPTVNFAGQDQLRCCICRHSFEVDDMTHCPAYAGPICSLCCSLDSRCHDMCKTDSRFSDQIILVLSWLLPQAWVKGLNSRIGHFLGLFLLISLVIAGLLLLVYLQITIDGRVEAQAVASALTKVYFILLIVAGVSAWMFSLLHDSRRVAEQESHKQTQLLLAEIQAHKETDRALQNAKEVAEAANKAKSRYLTGISHELRSPLNAILGYAQLLEKDEHIPPQRREALAIIKRSSEYLADLIEGLLDISRIEAGRLDLVRGPVALGAVLDQLVAMFSVQAQDKGIHFSYERHAPLPHTVNTDEKRLRQILINLLSNAIKFTPAGGSVQFSVRYRSQVAEFSIRDTGVGIEADDMERIFRPFERVRRSGEPHVAGTGLGLTITRLLTDILGGDISVTSVPGQGSHFKITLMLASIQDPVPALAETRTIVGYRGPQLTVCIVDDEPAHRSLLNEMLGPLGFHVILAPDGPTCLDMLRYRDPELFLLDISMPGMSGWDLARHIRERLPEATIFLISANANEYRADVSAPRDHDEYIVKPVNLDHLLDRIGFHLKLEWIFKSRDGTPTSGGQDFAASPPPPDYREALLHYARMGYAKGVRATLERMACDEQVDRPLVQRARALAQQFQYRALIDWLEGES